MPRNGVSGHLRGEGSPHVPGSGMKSSSLRRIFRFFADRKSGCCGTVIPGRKQMEFRICPDDAGRQARCKIQSMMLQIAVSSLLCQDALIRIAVFFLPGDPKKHIFDPEFRAGLAKRSGQPVQDHVCSESAEAEPRLVLCVNPGLRIHTAYGNRPLCLCKMTISFQTPSLSDPAAIHLQGRGTFLREPLNPDKVNHGSTSSFRAAASFASFASSCPGRSVK